MEKDEEDAARIAALQEKAQEWRAWSHQWLARLRIQGPEVEALDAGTVRSRLDRVLAIVEAMDEMAQTHLMRRLVNDEECDNPDCPVHGGRDLRPRAKA